jgi:LEA14-like dessication related protein
MNVNFLARICRTAGWAAVAAAVALAGAGCTAMAPKLETPKLSLVNLRLQEATLFEQRLQVRLLVQNPNDIALPVRGITFDIELAGEEFAQGVSARAFEVPALGEAEFDVLITANVATTVLRILDQGRGKRVESLDYRIRGKLSTSLGLLRSVPFDEKGTISLDSLMRGKDKA